MHRLQGSEEGLLQNSHWSERPGWVYLHFVQVRDLQFYTELAEFKTSFSFSREFSCNSEPEDYGILNAGNYNLDVDLVPNGAGDHVSFNEETAAIICDPIVG